MEQVAVSTSLVTSLRYRNKVGAYTNLNLIWKLLDLIGSSLPGIKLPRT